MIRGRPGEPDQASRHGSGPGYESAFVGDGATRELPRTRRRIAVCQSNYIPWKGYFDLIAHVDEFVLLDDVQYTKGDWRNRNRVKAPGGARWLTVPVTRGHHRRRILDATIADPRWHVRHLSTLRHYYRHAPCFAEMEGWLSGLYDLAGLSRLSEVNVVLIRAVCALLGIGTRISRSTDYATSVDRHERLIEICRGTGADVYVTGPRARSYLDEARFADAGIGVIYFPFGAYRQYPQPHPPFDHHVSVIDLILCTGQRARRYFRAEESSS
jgi:hypothetical protein